LPKNHDTSTKGLVLKVNGSDQLKAFLLSHNITIGAVFNLNYSPTFSQLVNLTVADKMLSLRKQEFNQIEWQAIE